MPADRRAEVGVELAPLFESLAEVDAEADLIRGEAAADAMRTSHASEVRADAIVADAKERAESVRAAAAARGRVRTAAAEEELVRSADVRVTRLGERAATGMAALVERALATARSELREYCGHGASTS